VIDLHVHSTFSDGSLTPEELVDRAREIGLTAIALTDHDSVDGVPRFLAACGGGPPEGIPGVEISAQVARGTLHILGYFIDPGDAKLARMLNRIRDGRGERNREIVARLNALGLTVKWEEVRAFAGEEVVGRPHFAQALLARGYVRSKDEAFEKYLAKGRPAYADRFRLPPAECIALIADAGGVPVLSHPFTMELGPKQLRAFTSSLKDAGLQGVEVYYSEHSASQQAEYLRLAAELDLVATGGSDFHGEANPAVKLGRGFGSLQVPEEAIEELRARRR